jgi:hypothetical protein
MVLLQGVDIHPMQCSRGSCTFTSLSQLLVAAHLSPATITWASHAAAGAAACSLLYHHRHGQVLPRVCAVCGAGRVYQGEGASVALQQPRQCCLQEASSWGSMLLLAIGCKACHGRVVQPSHAEATGSIASGFWYWFAFRGRQLVSMEPPHHQGVCHLHHPRFPSSDDQPLRCCCWISK